MSSRTSTAASEGSARAAASSWFGWRAVTWLLARRICLPRQVLSADIQRGNPVISIRADAPVSRDRVNRPDSEPAGDGGSWWRLARGFARGRRSPRLRAPGRDGAARAFLACVPGCREFVEDFAGGGGGDLPPLHDLADGRQERAGRVDARGDLAG